MDLLKAEYPELSAQVVAGAVTGAYATEEALAGGTEVMLARVASLARDHLDVVRHHQNLARHRFTRGYQLPADGAHAGGEGRAQVPCTYCRHPIRPESFVFWSTRGLLLSAICPDCHRQSTMRVSTWGRLSALPTGDDRLSVTSGAQA